jgi:TPP-dependent pyruvate/acetoin dehydrogenase alpha subunit
MAELWGRVDGCAGGRGGTMHLNDFELNYYGSNGIVGASLGIAMGAALAAKLRHDRRVAIGFFGEGGSNTGRTWEFVNFAAIQALPLIAICENNQYAVETHVDRATAAISIAQRAAGFGLPSVQIDGQDVCAVFRAITAARDRALDGGGPSFVEMLTYRYHGHNTGEISDYRTSDEVEEWRRTKDPIERLRAVLHERPVEDDATFEAIVNGARDVTQEAIAFAEASPEPDPSSAAKGVASVPFDVKGPAWARR